MRTELGSVALTISINSCADQHSILIMLGDDHLDTLAALILPLKRLHEYRIPYTSGEVKVLQEYYGNASFTGEFVSDTL